MVHKPKHKVHSFRGRLGHGGETEINLERQNVNLAYRITKFELLGIDCDEDMETTVKVYRESQSSIDANIDFNDGDLLAAGIYSQERNAHAYPEDSTVIFDNTIFSRNIYVTNKGVTYSTDINWYVELEEVPVTASTLMQLKLQVARKLSLEQG